LPYNIGTDQKVNTSRVFDYQNNKKHIVQRELVEAFYGSQQLGKARQFNVVNNVDHSNSTSVETNKNTSADWSRPASSNNVNLRDRYKSPTFSSTLPIKMDSKPDQTRPALSKSPSRIEGQRENQQASRVISKYFNFDDGRQEP
jgi:hypothetical protein